MSHGGLERTNISGEKLPISIQHFEHFVPVGYEIHIRRDLHVTFGSNLSVVLPLRGNRHAIALGNVVGYGVRVALLGPDVVSTIAALASEVDDPVRLVSRLSQHYRSRFDDNTYVTMFLGILDWERHALRYVSAGCQAGAALFFPDGSRRDLESTGPPVGLRVDVPFEERTIDMQPETLLCAWSDGLPDARRADDGLTEVFGLERLLELLARLRSAPLRDVASTVFEEVDAFAGEVSMTDVVGDQSLLLLRRSV